jgi:hypothetical protein
MRLEAGPHLLRYYRSMRCKDAAGRQAGSCMYYCPLTKKNKGITTCFIGMLTTCLLALPWQQAFVLRGGAHCTKHKHEDLHSQQL